MLGSTVAHHDSVGAGAADRFTLCPLLTASLSLESYPLADQFSLAGTTRANSLEFEPSGGEFCFGGSGEVHLWLVAVCIVAGGGQVPSVTVADVPTVGSRGRCLIGALSVCLENLLATLALSDDLGGVVCHDGGDQLVVSHLGGVVHAVSLQGQDAPRGGQGDSSHTEHQISDGVCDLSGTTPFHRGTMNGAHPNHAGLAPLLGDSVGVVHVGRPLTPILIEVLPGGGLDSDGVGHWSFRFDVISLQGHRRIRSPAVYSASAVTFRTGWKGCHSTMAAITISMVFIVRLFFTDPPSSH